MPTHITTATILTLPVGDADWTDDGELIDEMLTAWRAKSDRSRDNARYTVAAFARFLAERDATLATATTADCRDYLAARAEAVGAATVVKNWSQLLAFYRVAEGHSWDPLGGRRSPMRDVPMPAAPAFALTHAVTDGEYDALVAALRGSGSLKLRNHIAVSLMYRSGLRIGEVCALDVAALDVERRRVTVRWGKNDQPRTVPLHPETLALLARYLHPRRRGDAPGPLLVNVGGRRTSARLTVSAAQNIVKHAARDAGLANVTPHGLRRGAVVAYLRDGGSETRALTIFGWSRNEMILRYQADARADLAQEEFDRVNAQRERPSREYRALRAVGPR